MWNIGGRKSPKWVRSQPKNILCGIGGHGKDLPRMLRMAQNQWKSNIITLLHSSKTQNSIAKQVLDSQGSKKILFF